MSTSNFLAISLGANHLCSVHLKMNPSGRCEVLDYQVDDVDFSSSDPLLWLKAASSHLDAVAMRFRSDVPAGFSIPGHVALCKYLKIPQVSSGKRPKIVAYEAKQNIPYPIEEVTWDYSILDEDKLDFDAVIAATRTEIVETLTRYSTDSEIVLQGIQPSTAALVNCFRYNYSDVDECSLLISTGAKSSDLIFIEGARYHSRNVPFGGMSISSEMSEALRVTVAEAERIKISATCGERVSNEEREAFEAAKQSFTKRFLTEIVRTQAVLNRQGFNFEAKRVFLTGGGSLLSGLEERISERLRLPVERMDPIRNINVSDESLRTEIEQHIPSMADAIGMGVGRFMPDGASLDLTPRSLLWQRKFRRQQPFYVLAGLVACGAIALPIVNKTLELRAYEQELQNLEIQIRPLSQLNQEIYDRNEQIRKVQDVIEKASQIADARPAWIEVLNELQSRLAEVEDVWLDNLRLERPVSPATRGKGVARVEKTDTNARIQLVGRLIDVYNPVSSVSPDSYERVKSLLESFRNADFVAGLENESFDYSMPGILRFDFTLVVKEEVPL